MPQYKTTMLNDKLLVKANPQNSSITYANYGNIDKNNRLKQNRFKCIACNFKINLRNHLAKRIRVVWTGEAAFRL